MGFVPENQVRTRLPAGAKGSHQRGSATKRAVALGAILRRERRRSPRGAADVLHRLRCERRRSPQALPNPLPKPSTPIRCAGARRSNWSAPITGSTIRPCAVACSTSPGPWPSEPNGLRRNRSSPLEPVNLLCAVVMRRRLKTRGGSPENAIQPDVMGQAARRWHHRRGR